MSAGFEYPPVHETRPHDRPGFVWMGRQWLKESTLERRRRKARNRVRDRRENDPEFRRRERKANREYQRRRRAANPNHRRSKGENYRVRKYGPHGYQRGDYDRMVLAQSGRCAICENPARLHVDHCHDEGRIRGLLCNSCNVSVGRFDHDPAVLRRAADYLEE